MKGLLILLHLDTNCNMTQTRQIKNVTIPVIKKLFIIQAAPSLYHKSHLKQDNFISCMSSYGVLQCFDAVGSAAGRASGL